MIPRVLFVLSSLFVLFAAVEVANIHLGHEKTLSGKVVMITSVETSTKTLGLMEVKDHQTTHFLVDIAIEEIDNNFITRCAVTSLEGLEKDNLAEATVMIGKLYNDNRCLTLKLQDGVDSMVVQIPVSQ